MKPTQTLSLMLILALVPLQAQAMTPNLSKSLERLARAQKIRAGRHIQTVKNIMRERLGTLRVKLTATSDEVAYLASPARSAGDLYEVQRKQEIGRWVESIRARVRARQIPLMQGQEEARNMAKWLPVGELQKDGRTKLLRLENSDEFAKFLEDVPKPLGYRFDEATGVVYFDGFMPLEYHPIVSVLEHTGEDEVIWGLIHARFKAEEPLDADFVYRVSKFASEERALLNHHKIEAARLELDRLESRARWLRNRGVLDSPEMLQAQTQIERLKGEIEAWSDSLKGFDQLSIEEAEVHIARVTELVEEYAKLSAADARIGSRVDELNDLGDALGARQSGAAQKAIAQESKGPPQRRKPKGR